MLYRHKTKASKPFQLTAARRRLDSDQATPLSEVTVSTHSRPKAAGTFITDSKGRLIVSTHSRPKAAGCSVLSTPDSDLVSTHSRPKAAGCLKWSSNVLEYVSTHSRPKAAGHPACDLTILPHRFNSQPPEGGWAVRL